ncbi:receptor-like protein kinase At3g21340 isoform X2 [Capsella rubella]|uniref:receptor-like protein kinase At3g21340 isoform X2 n=1 Tax=Capsella rubella TaxID=81985 RepID=UPI000CD5C125|nr:receptor-like protein kinase At3g21340 isoform X2 [Capsella rubella]
MEKHPRGLLLYALIFVTFFAIVHNVQAQDQNGFISLDCGLSPNEPPYNDPTTGLTYSTDDGFVRSGEMGRIQKEFTSIFSKPSLNLRYFPKGLRNCYTFEVTQGTNYLIRAVFVYGNYDDLNSYPKFDLYLGPNLWATIDMAGRTNGTIQEIIHMTVSKSLQICLVKTGRSSPMINTLELRPLQNNTYKSQSGSLNYYFRYYFSASGQNIRYPDDVDDRKWYPFFNAKEWKELTTNLAINNSNGYEPPQIVMGSASTPISTSAPWNFTWFLPSPTTKFYMYMHFGEIETLDSSDNREFNVALNGELLYERYSPSTLVMRTLSDATAQQCEGGKCLLELTKTLNSTLPPLINALEVFTVIDFSHLETNEDDVVAMRSIQATYGLSNRLSWHGDPCVPKQYLWDGLNCNDLDMSTPPVVTILNLASSGLTGTISPAIENLRHLQKLDLSNNSLTGGIPEFLAGMKSLLVINLSGNNLNGPVPQTLLGKKELNLNLAGNRNLRCSGRLCVSRNGGAIVVSIAASVTFVVVLGVAVAIFVVIKRKNTSNSNGLVARTTRSSEPTIITKKKRFTYSEVITMTNNFEMVLGKGGFGMVYHGTENGTEQVAVKMLSHSSSQGYKEFKAEVELLLRVHHKNLVGLVGYCDEGENLALIYEYMANGDLREHISGNQRKSILDWETRLKIVVESAQGLEYLHNGCKPPMVHRDVKTTNILVNEHFQAKLADFGLSRSFPTEGETPVSTVVAGTPGYLDPEYYRTNCLNEKSDVYSFGIVLLEVITSQPVINQNRENPHIAEWVGVMLTNGDIKCIMDPKLCGDYDSSSVWRAVELAMSCLNPSSARRPTMSQVVIELNECLAYENARRGTNQNKNSETFMEVNMNFDIVTTPDAR